MIQVPIIDRAFEGGISMQGIMPTRMAWLWRWNTPQKFVVFTDRAIEAAEKDLCPQAAGATKIALLIEARHLDHTGYLTLQRLHHEFKYILTHETAIIDEFQGKSLWYPHGGCWIPSSDVRVDYPKTETVSIIASDKASTGGHKLRHAIVNQFRNRLKVFGRKYQPIEFKTPGLAPFMFSFAIENGWADDYFTEKLLDCFATGTVPIYWGTGGINRYFNMDGVIHLPFASQDEILKHVEALLPTLTTDRYVSMRPAIVDNYHRAKDYFNSEDWICAHYPFLFV
jgi:hypothetical protein